jgi:chloramphenicol-sensitive protein RarD
MALAGALIFVNWQTYVYGVLSNQVVEASLGYFINPIVTVFLGVFFLRERLRVIQWVSVGISILAVLVLAIGGNGVPWIALLLAFSFGFYGYIKKKVGPRVDAVSGLTLETAWLLPVAIVQLVVVGVTTGLTIGTAGPMHTALLVGTGVVTAVPLLFFAAASRRLPLVWMGFIQFFAPVIQFLVGVLILHEAMPTERWIGFGLVWLALVILTVDMAAGARRSSMRRNRAVPAAS